MIIIVTPPVEFNMRDRLLLFLCYHEKIGIARVHDWQMIKKLVRIGAKEGYRQNKTETCKNSLLLSTIYAIIQFSSVQSLSRVWFFTTAWIAACPVSLSITNSQISLKLTSIESVMPCSHLILCRPLLLPSNFPSIRVFSNESALRFRWPKYWSFSFSISPFKEHSGLISFRMDWLDLLAVQGTLKSLLQHHSSKASILWCSAFVTVQLSHP